VSEYIRQQALAVGFPAERTHVHYIGVDTELFAPALGHPRRTVIHVARLTEKKGTRDLIAAFAQVLRGVPDAQLLIIGDGPLRDDLQQLASRLGVTDEVRFLGTLAHAETRRQVASAAVFCLPSVTARSGDSEGLPISLIEAMASGVPVVGTRHAGIPEAITDGREGYLVDEADVESLAHRLTALLSDEQLRTSCARAARERALASFDLKTNTARLESLYDDILTTQAVAATPPQVARPRRTLLVASRSIPLHDGAGGMERIAWDLIRRLNEDYTIEVLTTPIAGYPDTFHHQGVAVRTVSGARSGPYSVRWWLGSAKHARSVAAPDYVLSISAGATAMSWLRPGPRYVFQAHGTALAEGIATIRTGGKLRVARFLRSVVWTAIDCLTYRRAAKVVAVGPVVYNALRRPPYRWFLHRSSLVEINNGVDERSFVADADQRAASRAMLGYAPTDVVAISISRLVQSKSVDVYVKALAAAMATSGDSVFKLLIVGSGPAEAELRELAERLQVSGSVTFAGTVDYGRVGDLLAASDVFVFAPMTTSREGNPLALLEARASGLPLITVEKLLPADTTGDHIQVVEPGDVQQITEALLRCRPAGAPRASSLLPSQTFDECYRGYLALFVRESGLTA
jgi:glycosyltransferase involved in cell wall biosynthesis